MKDINGKSEHEIMLERLQKWREEKGKTSVSKPQPVSKKRPVKSLGAVKPVHIAGHADDGRNKKPLQSFNSTTKVQGAVSRKSQGNQSLTKKPPVQKARRSAPPCRQQKSPATPMSKRLELWRAQRQNKSARKSSATKPPWKGGGTPALKKQTPTCTSTGKETRASTGKQSAERHSAQKEAMHSEQRENSLSQNRSSTSKILMQGNKDEQGIPELVNEDDHVPVPPTNLSSAFDEDGEYDIEIDNHVADVGGHDDEMDCQNSLSRTETPLMSDDGDDELAMNSSVEDEGLVSTQIDSEIAVNDERSSQNRKRKTPNRTYKSAFAQHKKVAKTEQRNVTFTTPLRCSPRLAKVGEAGDGSSATPKNKTDMRDRLQQWLLEKGKTPSRFSNLLNLKTNTPADRIRRLKARRPTPARHVQQAIDEGEGAVSLSRAREEAMVKLDATLAECLSLLHEGCPVDHVTHWLDDICRRLPMVELCAKYWLCRATATEIDGDYDDVIGVFEEAAEAEAQPVDEIKEGLKDLVMRMAAKGKTSKDGSYPSILKTPRLESVSQAITQKQTTPEFSPSNQSNEATPESLEQATPRPNKLINQGLAQFSGVKYCLTDTTPLFKRIEATPYFTPGLVITPVRRSIRLENRRSFLPDSLKDHDICVDSLEDLPEDTPSEFILRSNRALEGEFINGDDV